jgi:hypothetical protein
MSAALAPTAIAAARTLPRQAGSPWGWLERRPLAATLCLAFAAALLLQLWRPFFFLTGDTLTGTLPVSTEAYRRLWEGRSPFYNEYLFGGFSLLTDVGHFTLWSPLALPFSFLARTAYYYWLPDIVGTLSLVIIAGAFCWSALRLRQTLALPIPVALIVGLSLSYAFTPYNFIVGASWIGFLNVQATYPLVLAGAFERHQGRALAIQLTALLYAVFGGHMHLFTVLLVFGSLTVLLAAWVRRSGAPVFIWAAAGVLTLLLILPLLWPGFVCFNQTARSAGFKIDEASRNNVPWFSLGASFLLGPMAQQFLANGIRIDLSDRLYNLAIAFSLVNLPLVGLLLWKRRWTALETGFLALALAAVVCIARPLWLGTILVRLPVLRSLRWPFREIAVLQFFAHALFLVGFRPLTARAARMTVLACGAGGAALFALVFLSAAPTFCLFEPDRQLIISGEADRYWDRLRATHGSAGFPRFVVQAEPRMLLAKKAEVPFVLLGAFNYASLFRVHNISGFSNVPPPSAMWLETDLGVKHWFWGGIYGDRQTARIVAAHPDIQSIRLIGMQPPVWRVSNGTTAMDFGLDTRTWHAVELPPGL